VALGLAAGFLEPLESTSITLIQSGIERLAALFPDRRFDPALADEFNRITTLEYARIRDFLILHYYGNRRIGESMWDGCRAMALPGALAHKIRLFRSRGTMVRYEWESFQDPSWLSMFAGLDILPEAYDPIADHFTGEQLDGAMRRMREAIAKTVALATPHEAFLVQNGVAA
jgi:tryptophan halogenase